MRLLRYLDAATAQPSIESMAALRAALTDVVDRLKAHGLSAERVMAVLEALVCEHAATRRVLPVRIGTATTHDAAGVHAQLQRWCAQAYGDDAWW